MTQEQKDYLIDLASKDATLDNGVLVLKVQTLNTIIEELDERITRLTQDKLRSIGVRNTILTSIAGRDDIKQALFDSIVVT